MIYHSEKGFNGPVCARDESGIPCIETGTFVAQIGALLTPLQSPRGDCMF